MLQRGSQLPLARILHTFMRYQFGSLNLKVLKLNVTGVR